MDFQNYTEGFECIMDKIIIEDKSGQPKEYTILPHPVTTQEEADRLYGEETLPPLSEAQIEQCHSLGLPQQDIDFLATVVPLLRPVAIRLKGNIHRREQEKAQKAQQDLEALSRGELTEDMMRQQQQQERTRRMMQEARNYERQRIAKKYLSPKAILEAGIPRAFAPMTMEHIVAKGVPTQLVYQQGRVASFIEHIDDCLERGTGLIFTGPVGTMKTTFASSILLAGFAKGIEGRFELVLELMDRLVNLEKKNPAEYQAEMDRLCRVPLLVLDDMGAERRRGDFVLAKIEQIIFRRHANMLPIIITTNQTSKELLQTYSARIMDRLAERCPILVMEGPSGRLAS